MVLRCSFVLALLALVAAPASAAKTHREVFDSLFGKDMKRVQETASFADDAVFANELAEYTGGLEDSPQFAYYMHSQIYELGRLHRVGFLAALESIDAMMQIKPSHKAELLEKKLKIYTRAFKSLPRNKQKRVNEKMIELMMKVGTSFEENGNWKLSAKTYRAALAQKSVAPTTQEAEIREAIKRTDSKAIAENRADIFKKKLKSNPSDASAARMVARIYVVDMDDPATASKYVKSVKDETFKEMTPLAAMTVRTVAKEQLTPLAKWYQGLAKSAARNSRTAMQIRALAYFEEISRRGLTGDEAKYAEVQGKLLRSSLSKSGTSDWEIEKAISSLRGVEVGITEADVAESTEVASADTHDEGHGDVEEPVDQVDDVEVAFEDEPEAVPADDEESDIASDWKPRRRERHRAEGASIFDF